MSKSKFLQQTASAVTSLAALEEMVSGLAGVYAARGYAAGAADPITDADLTAAGIPLTAAQFNAQVVALLSDYLNFMGNVDTAAADRKAIANKARTDI